MAFQTAENAKLSEKPHILVVDDDNRIRDLVTRFLHDHDFVAMSAADAFQADNMLQRFDFDAMILDVMMPGQSGLDFLSHLRSNNEIPVLMLTALGEADDRISGLEQGADDYLAKPFEPRELVLRLQSILRRAQKRRSEKTLFRIGKWRFDPAHDELTNSDEIVRLTSVEATLLRGLADKSGKVVSREDLAIYCGIESGERTIDVQVTRLRRKIEENTKTPRYLQTVRGQGYILRADRI